MARNLNFPFLLLLLLSLPAHFCSEQRRRHEQRGYLRLRVFSLILFRLNFRTRPRLPVSIWGDSSIEKKRGCVSRYRRRRQGPDPPTNHPILHHSQSPISFLAVAAEAAAAAGSTTIERCPNSRTKRPACYYVRHVRMNIDHRQTK